MCAVKLECDRLLAAKCGGPPSNTTPQPVGQLRHITEDSILDSVLEDVTDVDLDMTLDMTSNDTNKDALLYFERLSKHYLHLVKSSPSAQQFSRHGMKFQS